MTDRSTGLLGRLFPRTIDKDFPGSRAALWLLGAYVGLKLIMSFNSIFNSAKVAQGADGIPLDSYGPAAAREVLLLFSLTALGQLALVLVALAALVRCRGMVPFVTLVLLGEAVGRRLIVYSYATVPADNLSAGFAINIGLIALLAIALVLSVIGRRD